MQSKPEPCNLAQWLDYLEQSHAQEIQLGLDRIRKVAFDLDLLKPSCPVITVAGTNGKGSTITALEMLYYSAGYKVGAYTSPHLHQFNERIRINNQPILDNDLCAAFKTIEKGRGSTPLTYFEVATLAALWYFNAHKLDLILLETGLGGRLDATNIIDASVSIITTIDFDHEAFLGNTLDAIGFEKAGIMRTGKPCIFADYLPPDAIKQYARQQAVPLLYLDEDYHIEEREKTFDLMDKTGKSTFEKPGIQVKSAAAAIMAARLLQDQLPVNETCVQTAMKNIFIPGRLELSGDAIRVLYDVSHNPQSARLLAHYLESMPAKKVHAVFAALKDKNLQGLIDPLRDCVDYWYPAQLDNKRASSRMMMHQVFQELNLHAQDFYECPEAAFKTASHQAQTGDVIVVYGSFFTVAAIRGIYKEK